MNSVFHQSFEKESNPSVWRVVAPPLSIVGASDYIDNFVKRKHGRERVEMIDPSLEYLNHNLWHHALPETGVMQVAQHFGGFSLEEGGIFLAGNGQENAAEMHKKMEEKNLSRRPSN